MKVFLKKTSIVLLIAISIFSILYFALSFYTKPEKINYGVSFSAQYARELGLDWKDTYIQILDDLKVKKLRLVAYWPVVEPNNDQFDFSEIDFQLNEASKRDAKVILAVGRRLPRWPECHIPSWAEKMTWDEEKEQIKEYLRKIVEKYKNDPTISYWQVENEPYLKYFAEEQCGKLDEDFLHEEIALVKSIDKDTPILVTDSGNIGLWKGAYTSGDSFGTSVYIYLWNPELGKLKSWLPPSFYRVKANLMKVFYGNKDIKLIELSIEPWLTQPIKDTTLDIQLDRMSIEKFIEIINFAKDTRFEEQYLWGAEWWYWLKVKHGNSSFWNTARDVFGGML